jgi:cytochrome c-type biogenesis protein CcmH/NrfG
MTATTITTAATSPHLRALAINIATTPHTDLTSISTKSNIIRPTSFLTTKQQTQDVTLTNETNNQGDVLEGHQKEEEEEAEAEAEAEAEKGPKNPWVVFIVIALIFLILIILLVIALLTEVHAWCCALIARKRDERKERTESDRFEAQLAATVHWQKMPPGERGDNII